MSVWEVSAAVLTGCLVPCLVVCVRAGAASALAAFELAGTLATTVLMVLAEAFGRQPFIDLALVLALLTLVGALALARLMEQDL